MKKAVILYLGLVFGICPHTFSADFNGDFRRDIAIYRPSTGLWAIRGVTRVYFGRESDLPLPGDYTGDGNAEIAVYRPETGLWAVRGVTRVYFGGGEDIPVAGAEGQKLYDYIVKPSDGADLVDALQSEAYRSVFIPAGYYRIDSTITVENVGLIAGQGPLSTSLVFSGENYLEIKKSTCHLRYITAVNGGSDNRPNFHIDAPLVTLDYCASIDSGGNGFECGPEAYLTQFADCMAVSADKVGFAGRDGKLSRFTDCTALRCRETGFRGGGNVVGCLAVGDNNTRFGFFSCDYLSSCQAIGVSEIGFASCRRVSSSGVDGKETTKYGFYACGNLSSCHVDFLQGAAAEYESCWNYSTDRTGSCD